MAECDLETEIKLCLKYFIFHIYILERLRSWAGASWSGSKMIIYVGIDQVQKASNANGQEKHHITLHYSIDGILYI